MNHRIVTASTGQSEFKLYWLLFKMRMGFFMVLLKEMVNRNAISMFICEDWGWATIKTFKLVKCIWKQCGCQDCNSNGTNSKYHAWILIDKSCSLFASVSREYEFYIILPQLKAYKSHVKYSLDLKLLIGWKSERSCKLILSSYMSKERIFLPIVNRGDCFLQKVVSYTRKEKQTTFWVALDRYYSQRK